VLTVSSVYAPGPDTTGHYGSATSDAIAEFQQNYSIQYTGVLGECDLATYQALIQVISSSTSNQTAQ
jgi:peptidoglycan hydrolase-like protein with peptidoglycan-binding domain